MSGRYSSTSNRQQQQRGGQGQGGGGGGRRRASADDDDSEANRPVRQPQRLTPRSGWVDPNRNPSSSASASASQSGGSRAGAAGSGSAGGVTRTPSIISSKSGQNPGRRRIPDSEILAQAGLTEEELVKAMVAATARNSRETLRPPTTSIAPAVSATGLRRGAAPSPSSKRTSSSSAQNDATYNRYAEKVAAANTQERYNYYNELNNSSSSNNNNNETSTTNNSTSQDGDRTETTEDAAARPPNLARGGTGVVSTPGAVAVDGVDVAQSQFARNLAQRTRKRRGAAAATADNGEDEVSNDNNNNNSPDEPVWDDYWDNLQYTEGAEETPTARAPQPPGQAAAPQATYYPSRRTRSAEIAQVTPTTTTVATPATIITQDEPLIAAELAPDEDNVAARVAERLSAEMQARLKREVSHQLEQQQQRQRTSIASATVISSDVEQALPSRRKHGDIEQASTVPNTSTSSQDVTNNIQDNNQGQDDENKDNFRVCGLRRSCWGILLVVVLILGAGAAFGVWYLQDEWGSGDGSPFGSNNDNNNNNDGDGSSSGPSGPSPAPTTQFQGDAEWLKGQLSSYLDPLFTGVGRDSTEDELWNVQNSPESLALEWLVENDMEYIRTRYSTIASTINAAAATHFVVERYSVTVLFFATDGTTWKEWNGFLTTNTSICEWNNGLIADPIVNTFGTNSTDAPDTGVSFAKSSNARGVFCRDAYKDNDEDDVVNNNPESVVSLLLSDNGLEGSLPRQLSLLSNIRRIDFDSNIVGGTIATEIGRLSNLQNFWFNSNALQGSLPTHLSRLTKLESIDLEANALNGPLPKEFGGTASNGSTGPALSNLFFLGLRSNEFEGTLPTEWSNLVSLRLLDLDKNMIDGTIPTEYGIKLSNMELLYLEQNRLTGTIPTEIGIHMTKLIRFLIYDNELTGTIPTTLGLLTNLQSLYLYDNELTGSLDNGYLCQAVGDTTNGNDDDISWMLVPPALEDFRTDCLVPPANGDEQPPPPPPGGEDDEEGGSATMNPEEQDGTDSNNEYLSEVYCPCCTECCHQQQPSSSSSSESTCKEQ